MPGKITLGQLELGSGRTEISEVAVQEMKQLRCSPVVPELPSTTLEASRLIPYTSR
jgi:hypothetical protein